MTPERKASPETDDAARYRRPRRPLEVRRRSPWKEGVNSAVRILLLTGSVAALGGGGWLLYHWAMTAPLFQLPGLTAVEVVNVEQVSPEAVRERFAADVGRSIFAVPLPARRRHLEEILWVEAATVQRVFPNRLHAYVRERTPVAFLRQGYSLWLVDAEGIILPAPEGASYSFPVLIGLSKELSPAARQAQVQLYLDFIEELDAGGKDYSVQLSEVDLSDTHNLRASLAEGDGAVWLYFGRGDYQEKFEAFLQHRALWQQSGESVRSVDLRYRGQIVLNPEDPGSERGQ